MKKSLVFWLFALLLLTACGSSEVAQQTGDTAQASQITVYNRQPEVAVATGVTI